MDDEKKLAFRFDCGATWLNLLATRGRSFSAHPVERLATPARLAEWLDRCELTPALPPGRADLEQAWEVREILRALALTTVSEGPVSEGPSPGEAVAALATFVTDHDDPVHLIAGDRLVRQAPPSTSSALARIARQAIDHLTGPERHTLKSCPEHDCRGIFADPTDRRHWCPSPACASRGRVRALRARRNADAQNQG